ncbi:MAG: VOC family protein [Acidobacteriota bacterium]
MINNVETADSGIRALAMNGFAYIEFYVGNVRQVSHYFRTMFSFTPAAFFGLETGVRDKVSLVLRQGEINLILTSSLVPNSAIAEHVRLHGDGVKDIAFLVDDVEVCFHESVSRGAKPVLAPITLTKQGGQIVKATIGAFGDTVQSFIQCDKDCELFSPVL